MDAELKSAAPDRVALVPSRRIVRRYWCLLREVQDHELQSSISKTSAAYPTPRSAFRDLRMPGTWEWRARVFGLRARCLGLGRKSRNARMYGESWHALIHSRSAGDQRLRSLSCCTGSITNATHGIRFLCQTIWAIKERKESRIDPRPLSTNEHYPS
jgi:hypothetical protein